MALVKKGWARRKAVGGTSPKGEGSTRLTTATVTYGEENGRGSTIEKENKNDTHQSSRLTTAARGLASANWQCLYAEYPNSGYTDPNCNILSYNNLQNDAVTP